MRNGESVLKQRDLVQKCSKRKFREETIEERAKKKESKENVKAERRSFN